MVCRHFSTAALLQVLQTFISKFEGVTVNSLVDMVFLHKTASILYIVFKEEKAYVYILMKRARALETQHADRNSMI
jgi:hypothetical protein